MLINYVGMLFLFTCNVVRTLFVFNVSLFRFLNVSCWFLLSLIGILFEVLAVPCWFLYFLIVILLSLPRNLNLLYGL